MSEELELLRRVHYGSLGEDELLEIYNRFRDNRRIMTAVLQHPRFPPRFAPEIVSRLFPSELTKVSGNRRTNPFIREKAEMEFSQRYPKLPLGEKISLLKRAPVSLLMRFVEEKNPQVLAAMLTNPYCTEDLVVRLIHRRAPRHDVFLALLETEWYKRPGVAEAIVHDKTAPIRVLLAVLPHLDLRSLHHLHEAAHTHEIVRRGIIELYNAKRARDYGES